METLQKEIVLSPRKRGFHLVTREIMQQLPELTRIKAGIAHIHIKHTSASLTLNENADPDVRVDMESFFNRVVPDSSSWMIHTMEGPDDMPAHVKASLLGSSVSVPVTDGRFNLGTWQGIYLGEHRDHGGSRRLVITVMGTL